MRQAWLPAAPEGAPQARAIVRDLSSELSLDGETSWALMLATTEAFANAVEHGVPCPARGILLRVETRGDTVSVEVSDCGSGIPAQPRTSKPRGMGGRGIPLIEAVTDRLELAPEAGTSTVRFEKRVAAAA